MLQTTVEDWNGYKKINFTVGGRESYIVCPKEPLPGNPWAWRAEFFPAFDYVDRELLEKGWFRAYHCASDMYGCPESVEMMEEFYETVTAEFGLAPRPAIFGFSRGGLYTVNFALKYPSHCGLMYLDAPVLDIRSWPAGRGKGIPAPECWEGCKAWYHLTEETAGDFKGNPLDRVKEIAELKIPIIICCGDSDSHVPFEENALPFFNEFKNYSDDIEMIVKAGCDHHPHSLTKPFPIVDYIEKHILK